MLDVTYGAGLSQSEDYRAVSVVVRPKQLDLPLYSSACLSHYKACWYQTERVYELPLVL